MRAKFGSFLDASLTDENCELRCRTSKLRIRRETESRHLIKVIQKGSRAASWHPRSWQTVSLVEAMTGPDQVRMLADQLQAGAMLRYNCNKRMVG